MLKLNKQNGRKSREKAIAMLTRLGLEDRLNSLPGQLSGGQQQRARIALSMVQEANYLLLDEPMSGLDNEQQSDVISLLQSLRDRHGKTLVIILHDLHQVSRLADVIIQIKDEKINTDFSVIPSAVLNLQE